MKNGIKMYQILKWKGFVLGGVHIVVYLILIFLLINSDAKFQLICFYSYFLFLIS
jgi:hypothetical protein